MSELPKVLCGPMVRRTEAEGACVWVALSEAAKVKLSVYPKNPSGSSPVATGERATIELAPRLHVAAVTARPQAGQAALEWGEIYGYDLLFERNGSAVDLDAEGVLGFEATPTERIARIVFPGEASPSFCLPAAEREQYRLVQGSCRKAHGKGREMLGKLHDDLAGVLNDPDRPQQLFLTGDQIYADDVASPMFRAILETIGRIGNGGDPERNGELADYEGLLGEGDREDFVRNIAGFSSGESDNHLVTLLEWYSIYLLTWSSVLWPAAQRDHKKVQGFTSILPKVRRLLANVSTYMTFDDHEVTDDWYRSAEWVQEMSGSEQGQRLVRNGLAAFAVFQQWGNEPFKFESGLSGGHLLTALDGWDGQSGSKEAAIRKYIFVPKPGQTLDDLPDDATRWSFQLGTPCVRIVGLDCRTRRELTHSQDYPGIMTRKAIDDVLPPAIGSPADVMTLIVSPVPVLGIRLIENLQGFARRLGLGNEFDVEPWGLHKDTYDYLLERLASFRRVVILSGDIHFAFSSSLVGKEEPYEGARLVNFTSSALRNKSLPRALAVLLKITGDSRLEGVVGQKSAPNELETIMDRPQGLETAAGGLFEESILIDEAPLLEGVDPLEESVDGSQRRVAALSDSNYGTIRFGAATVSHGHWWWREGESSPKLTTHTATFPPINTE